MTYKAIKICSVFFLFVLAMPFLNSCEEEEDDLAGDWVELSSFNGPPRSRAVTFTIGSMAYYGTGYNDDNDDNIDYLNDFWKYDSEKDTWSQIASFPGAARCNAVAFATDTKGYVGTGWTGNARLKDFYEYDPIANTWTPIADFGGSSRYSATAFAINNIGYVGTGKSESYNLKDFYKYDPSSNTWTEITTFGGTKRREATNFVIDGKAYLTTGIDNGNCDDLWEFDPSTETWTEKRKITNDDDEEFDDLYDNIIGYGKVGFSLNGKGYVATGGTAGIGLYVWEYDPILDLWVERQEFEAGNRGEACAFVFNNVAYVTSGEYSNAYYDDLWGFYPYFEYDEHDYRDE